MKIALHSFDSYHRLLSYPDEDPELQEELCWQLRNLGVEYLLPDGSVRLAGLPLLGFGYCGVVVAGCWCGQAVAIKVRRRSCHQKDLEQEAALQQQANQLGIGPKLYCHRRGIMVMERLSGASFADWLAPLTRSDASLVQQVLYNLITQCFVLDQAGVDHGALRCISEHVFVAKQQPTIIDFSHSSAERHPNNVTALISGLLWGTKLAQRLGEIISVPEPDSMRQLLRGYKQQPCCDNLKLLLQALGLTQLDDQLSCL
jgi:predicted Ser/Thr protein kinase